MYINTANSATLTFGYNYSTAYANRKTLLASVTGVKMKTSTGWMDIDLTDVIKAYVRDGTNSTMRLWGYGTGGSTTSSYFRGYNPSSGTSQRPYLQLTYSDSSVWYNNNGTWVQCAAYYNNNGSWIQVMPYYNNGGTWIQV